MTHRFWMALSLALAAAGLNGCGGGSLAKEGYVRLLNATTDYPSLDLFSSTTGVSGAVLAESVGDYAKLAKASVTFNLKVTGSGGVVVSSSQTIGTDLRNTLVAYTSGGTLKTAYLDDNEAAPSANAAKFRVFHAAATEAGKVDVYLTSGTCAALPSSAVATVASVSELGAYAEVSVGSYRVCVTGVGDKADLRLDIAALALANQQIGTLVLTRSGGGVLLNGMLLNQQGTLTRARNTSARVRVAASASATGIVNATANGVALGGNYASPAVGTYRLVPAGALAVSASINGVPVPATGLNAPAGADLTLLLAGTSAAPTVALLNDDNTPSTSSTNSARLRLVNGLNGAPGGLTLTYDNAVVADSVAFGAAATAGNVAPSSTTTRLEVTYAGASLYLTTGTAAPLVAGKVYTLFLLGDAAAPTGIFRVDR